MNRFHVNDPAIHNEVAAFDQLDSHLLSEEAVFEVSAVVDAWREQHDLPVISSSRGEAVENAGEFRGIVVHGEDFVSLKGVGKRAHHDGAVLQHVRDAAGRAHIVLEHAVLAGLRVTDQVDAADMRVNPARDLDADHFAHEMLAGIDEGAGNLAVRKNALLAVDVLQEQVQRHHALRKAAIDALPF